MARSLRTITVRDLIGMLEGQDPDIKVVFSADYGDRCHTAQALPLRGECDTVSVIASAYSNSGFAIAQPDEDDEGSDETFLVIR